MSVGFYRINKGGLHTLYSQGAATPMYPVLAAATGIKLESMDQHRLTARVKKPRAPFGADQPIKN